MGNYSRDLTILMHMKVYCRQISETLDRFEKTYENFVRDNDFQDSIAMKIFQIGELVNHLSSDYLIETQNEINWNDIRGMRNRFAHGYFEMDRKIIFNVAQRDIPNLKLFLEKEVQRLSDLESK